MPTDREKARDFLKQEAQKYQAQPPETTTATPPPPQGEEGDYGTLFQQWAQERGPSLNLQPLPAWQGNFQVPTGNTMVAPDPLDFIDSWRQSEYPKQFQGTDFIGGENLLGPGGKELPKNALGWDWYGEPYFGEGISGWWDKIKSKVATEDTEFDWEKNLQTEEARTFQVFPDKNTIENIWGGLKTIGQAASSGAFSRGLGAGLRGIQAGVIGVLDIFNEPSEKLEQALAAGSYVAEATIYDTVNAAYGGGEKGDAMAKLAVGLASMRRVDDFEALTNYMRGPTPNYNILSQFDGDNWNITEGGLPGVKKGSELDTAWRAGKMLYTGAINPLAYKEAQRRIQAGEEPTLVVNELQNPWAEMGGQMILDPLNFIGPFKMKQLQGARRIENAKDLTMASDDLVRSMDDVERFARVNADEVNRVANRLEKTSLKYNAFTLTPAGKRFVASQHVSNYLGWALSHSDDPVDAIKYLIYSVSKDPGELMEALAFAGNQPGGNAMFSQAGREAGLFLREMMTSDVASVAGKANAPKMTKAGKPLTGKALANATARMAKYQEGQDVATAAKGARRIGDYTSIQIDPSKFLDELREAQKEGPEAVLEIITRRMDRAIEAFFPTVKQREEAIKLIKSGKDIPDDLRVAARQYEAGFRNNPLTRALTKQDAALQKWIYGPMNRFFANVYMGASPGYAFRNMSNNIMTTVIDVGWGASSPRPTSAIQESIMELSGGTLMQGAKGGYGTGAVFTGQEVAKYHKNVLTAFGKGGFRGVSEIFENWSAANVIETAFKDSMMKMVERGFPSVQPLVDAGIDVETAQGLLRRLIKNKYDVAKTMNEVKLELGAGKINVFKEMKWVPNSTKATLYKLNMDGVVNDIVQNSEDIAAVRKGFSDMRANIWKDTEQLVDADVIREIPIITDTGEEWAEDVAAITEAVEGGYVDEVQGIYYAHHTEQNSRAINTYQDTISDLVKEYEVPKPLHDKAVDYVQKKMGTRLALDTKRKRELSWRLNNESFRDGFNIQTAMQRLVQEGFRPISGMPETPKQFRRVLWSEFYEGTIRQNWQTFRDEYAINGEVMLKEFQRALKSRKIDIPTSRLGKARLELARAQQWDDFIDTNDVKVAIANALDRNDLAQCARIYANQFGIASATATGAPLDKKILNIINKVQEAKGDTAFQRLSDVPEEVSHTNLYSYVMSRVKASTDAEVEAMLPPEQLIILKDKIAGSKPGYIPYTIDKADVELRSFTEDVYQNPQRYEELWNRFREYALAVRGDLARGDFTPGFFREDLFQETRGGKVIWQGPTSTNPEWWRGMKEKYGVSHPSKPKTLLYLDQIAKGVADINTKSVEALMDEIVAQMLDPDVGDPVTMLAYGMERRAFARLSRMLDEGFNLEEVLSPNDYQRAIDLLGKDPLDLVDKYTDAVVDRFFFNEYSALAEKYLPKKMPTPAAPIETPPSAARAMMENKDGMLSMLNQLETLAIQNFDQYRPAFIDKTVDSAMNAFQKRLSDIVSQSQLTSGEVAEAARKFALLSYPEKTYADLALAYIFPYQFWYSRSYANWLQRLAYNPEVIAAYAKYRTALEQAHAGAPDWWKYQINTNELLGLDSDNPLFFNLEATLNPLNGLTGTDFSDPDRRKAWYASLVDDLGKFGPSVWTPYQWVVALALKAEGEQEAARKFAGRLFPQSNAVRSLLSYGQDLLGKEPAMIFGGVNEVDPMVWLQGGVDPYEERRIGRALAEINAPPEQLLDAARTHSGSLWEQAAELALRKRRAGNLSSFLLGVGFKARSVTDMQIDQFDQEKRMLMAMKAQFQTPEAYSQAWDDLKTKYPFADLVTLSRGSGPERDEAYVYNVLSRLPPGYRDDMMKSIGGDTMPELISRFYAAKGDMSGWAETDRQRFMATIVDFGALMKLPDGATKAEWREASNRYRNMRTQAEKQFGDNIWELVDGYFAAKKISTGKADEYLQYHPEVGQVLDWKSTYTASDPLYAQYYGSIDDIYRYYTNVMYDNIKVQVGEDVWQQWSEYFDAKLTGDQKRYWNDHPDLQKYVDLKSKYLREIASTVLKSADNLRLPTYGARMQTPTSLGQERAEEAMVPEPTFLDITWDDIDQRMTPALQRLVIDSLMTGNPMDYRVEEQFNDAAEKMGLEPAVLEELMRRLIYR